MTFSSKVKNEIINSNIAVGNELSMLCGIILSAGTIVISNIDNLRSNDHY